MTAYFGLLNQPITCPYADICNAACQEECGPKSGTECRQRIEEYEDRAGFYYRIEVRNVVNDVVVGKWWRFDEWGVYSTFEQALAKCEAECGDIHPVGFSGKFFEPDNNNRIQIRFVTTKQLATEQMDIYKKIKNELSPWRVGLNDKP